MGLAKLTVRGLEWWMRDHDDSLFSDIVLPDNIDKNTLVDSILISAGEFEALYSDPKFYKFSIENFFQKYNRTFTKWIEGIMLEYEPLDNYDRKEEWSDNSTGSTNRQVTNGASHTSSDTKSSTTTGDASHISKGEINGTSTESNEGSDRSTTENRVSAYNSSSYQPDTQVSFTDATTQDTTTTTANTNNSTTTDNTTSRTNDTTNVTSNDNSSSNEVGNDSNTSLHTGRIHGNIGVTTSMKLQEEYIEIFKKYNIYDMIVDLFVDNCCILIYD